MNPTTVGLLGIFCFFLLITLRMPIAYAMALVGFFGFSYLTSMSAAFALVSKDLFSTFSNYSLSVIPMFIWMGFLAFHAGIGARLYRLAYKLVGHLPGGLAIATQATCALFGAVCGSNTATAATIGAIALPEMNKYKYDPSLSTASVAAGGALGVLIPPSVIFIVYGIAAEQSVGKLFLAGIIPGFLLMFLYMFTIYIVARRNPLLGPAGPKSSWDSRFRALGGGLFEVLAIFAISLGGLFAGWFTPTEAGAVGVAGVALVTAVQKGLTLQIIRKSLADTTRTTAMIMLLIYLVLGCFIDALALILLTIPIFLPVAVTVLGYDPIWFGVIIVMVVAMGVITPPVGMNVYIVKGVAGNVPLEVIFKGIWPFLFAIFVCLALLIAFPGLATFLPSLLD